MNRIEKVGVLIGLLLITIVLAQLAFGIPNWWTALQFFVELWVILGPAWFIARYMVKGIDLFKLGSNSRVWWTIYDLLICVIASLISFMITKLFAATPGMVTYAILIWNPKFIALFSLLGLIAGLFGCLEDWITGKKP